MDLSIDHALAERLDLELEITLDHRKFIVAEVAEHLLQAVPRLHEEVPVLLELPVRDLDQHLAPVVRVADAAHETGPFQTVDHAGDRAGGEAGELREAAGGERSGRP